MPSHIINNLNLLFKEVTILAKKIFLNAFDENSQPSEDVVSVNGVSFKYDKPFFLICNYPIKDKAYFEFYVDDYYPIKAFRNIPLYVGISQEVSFGVLNSDFIIGSLYYNAETTEYDIMSKYSRQYINYHTQPEHIYTRLPGAKDIIGVGADFENNCINIFVNGKLFYRIQNNTYDEDGNVLTSFDLTSGTFYFCIWSNVYYKKILSDFNENSGNTELEKTKEISGSVNFGPSESGYKPDGYEYMSTIYAEYVNPPDPEDDPESYDSFIFDPSLYDGMENINAYIGGDDNDCTVYINNPIDVSIKTMALVHYPDIDPITQLPVDDGVEIIDKYKYTMNACEDPTEQYFLNGSTIFINKPIPTDRPVYFEFYVTEGQLKNNKVGIPISIGITGYEQEILSKSSRLDLYHDPWYHYYWKEMDNTSTLNPSQHLHEIDNVLTTTPPVQGQVIGVALNLKKNKMTIFIDNAKFYTMYTNRAVDRVSGETFTIIKDETTGYLTFTGSRGTTYTQTRSILTDEGFTHHFECSTGKAYDGYYNEYSGRFELFEENSILHLDHVEDNLFTMNGIVYTRVEMSDYSNYVDFVGTNGIHYTQIKSDVLQRSTDQVMFEFRMNDLTIDYKLWKVNSNKQLIYSDLDYSNPWDFTYAFIHDEGAFNGTVKGNFNFGQDPFAATMPDNYISLWDYYSISSRIHVIKDIESKINIVNNNHIFAILPSLVKIINTSSDYPYQNNGLNKLMLTHNIINDTEAHYYNLDGIDISDFTAMIARENNGYIPEEKLNSTTISFEGVVHYTITIPTLEHQYIEAYLNSRNKYTTTFQAPKGAAVSVKLIPEFGYTEGTLNVEKFTVVEDITLSATQAQLTNFTVNLISGANEHIEVWEVYDYDSEGDPIYDDPERMYDSRIVSKFTTNINSTLWFVKVIADYGYNAGKCNYLGLLNINKDITISAEDARIASYTVTVPNTYHSVIGVRYNNVTYLSKKIGSEGSSEPVSFEVPFNTTVYISIEEVDIGYKVEGEWTTYQVVTKDIDIEVPTIVDDMCTITVDRSRYVGEISISNSTKDGDVYTIRRGDEVTITLDPADGLYVEDFILE